MENYHQQFGYLIPSLSLPPEEEKTIRIWGQRHKRYLKEHRKATYTTLLISGKPNTDLAEIDQQAQKRFERLIEQMKQPQDITEQLKFKSHRLLLFIQPGIIYTDFLGGLLCLNI